MQDSGKEAGGIRSIRLKKYPIYIGDKVTGLMPVLLNQAEYSSLVVITDSNTREHCLPRLRAVLPPHHVIEIPAGEPHKNIDTLQYLWQSFTQLNLDRNTLALNLGGGVLTDLAGFAEATYKRGISFWNIPTTLMGMVDASLGGKTGLDFFGFKNQVGVFRDPAAILVWPPFLETLDPRELRSGLAEVAKHGLIRDAELWNRIRTTDMAFMPGEEIIGSSIWVKADLVQLDPYEKKLRKALNFGHSIGHALESWSLAHAGKDFLLHGEAIAVGMICESHISFSKGLLSETELHEITQWLYTHYPFVMLNADAENEILSRLVQDKKNESGRFLFSLPDGIGRYRVNVETTEDEVRASLQYYRSLLP